MSERWYRRRAWGIVADATVFAFIAFYAATTDRGVVAYIVCGCMTFGYGCSVWHQRNKARK